MSFLPITTQGGWDSLDNLRRTVGLPTGDFTSPNFPAPQRERVISEIAQPAGGTGQTFRPTLPDFRSGIETAAMFARDWIDSPHELQFGVPTKIAESKSLAKSMGDSGRGISGFLSDIAKSAGPIRTIANTFYDITGAFSRESISEGPREVGNSRGVVQYQDADTVTRADVTSMLTGFWNQAKGLFGLNYQEPGGVQPVSPVPSVSGGISNKLLLGAAAIGALLLLRKK